MDIHSFVLALLAACTIAADPGDTTLAPTEEPAKEACQGNSYDKATCEAVGCCRWNVLLGCRPDGDAECPESDATTTVTQEAQTDPPATTTTKSSGSWDAWTIVWFCCLVLGFWLCMLLLCLTVCCAKKKKKEYKGRETHVSQPSPEPVVVEEQREFLPMTAMQGIGGSGTQALPAMGGGGFGTQALPRMF